jgi:hypothetical protein
VREGFVDVLKNAFAGMGFPREAPFLTVPDRMCVPASDLSPVREGISKIVNGLTKWEPKTKAKGASTPPMLTVAGKDYEEAAANVNRLFLKNMWSDGLPILPPTEERVNWILTGTSLPRSKAIGKIMPAGGIATPETLAVSLAMAGGRPEYLPVLIATVEAMVQPEFYHHFVNATTGNPFPLVVLNGPVAKQIRLNSGYGCMGPSPLFPAGTSIGRALRFALLDIGGGIPGITSMSMQGSNRVANVVFAEDEEHMPLGQGWEPLSVDQGFSRGVNVVTVIPAAQVDFIMASTVSTEETAKRCIRDYSWAIGVPSTMPGASFNFGRPYGGTGAVNTKGSVYGMAIFPANTARGFAASGYPKEAVRRAFWEASKMPWAMVKSIYGPDRIKKIIADSGGVFAEGQPWPVSVEPKSLYIAVAGGEQSDHAIWVMCGGASGWTGVSREIMLPLKSVQDKLLEQAEKELGPIPLPQWTGN